METNDDNRKAGRGLVELPPCLKSSKANWIVTAIYVVFFILTTWVFKIGLHWAGPLSLLTGVLCIIGGIISFMQHYMPAGRVLTIFGVLATILGIIMVI